MKKQYVHIMPIKSAIACRPGYNGSVFLIPFEPKPVKREVFYDYEVMNLKAAYAAGLIDEVFCLQKLRELRERKDAA